MAVEDLSSAGRQASLTLPTPMVVMKTQKVLTKQAEKIAKHADKHENFLNKVTYCLGVLSFGLFCYLLGSSPQDIPRIYCLFFIFVAPLRWIYYRIKKWHYYLLDFCYYANAIFVSMLLFFPNNKRLFMVCFSFSEGPLAWALIVWRCSLVFSSIDKCISVLIHLLPGTVFFILRWWDSSTFPLHSIEETGSWPVWPVVNSIPTLWMWLFFVPLMVYCIWQALYFLVVEGLRRQRILRDPDIMTSYRELKRKAERANNIWWWLSGLLGAENRVYMYAIIQAVFTVATLALTVPMFKSYRLHIGFEIFKLSATVWNGGNFVFEVMPHQAAKIEAKRGIKDGAGVKAGMVLSPPNLTSNAQDMDTSAEGVASYANTVSGNFRTEKQAVCAICKRPSPQSMARSIDEGRNDRVGRKCGPGDDASTFRMLRTTVGNHQVLPRREAACITGIDAATRGLEWSGQVACAG